MIHDGFYQWLLNNEYAEGTAKTYTRKLDYISLKEDDPVYLSEEVISAFLLSENTSPSNHNHWVASLKAYARYCQSKETPVSYVGALESKKVPKRLPKPLEQKTINELCDAIDLRSLVGIRDRAIIEILYCGLRNHEVCGLNRYAIEDRSLRVIGKGNKERIVPVNRVAWGFLMDYILISQGDPEIIEIAERNKSDAFRVLVDRIGDGPVFFTQDNTPIHTKYVWEVVNKRATDVGARGVHPHRFRHSFATHILDSGYDNLLYIKDVMGHSSLNTTHLYVEVSSRGREDLNAHHPRERE